MASDRPFPKVPVPSGIARPDALIVVAAALVDRAGSVLAQRRPETREHGGLWEFPGGKLERGEGVIEALVRELREELAIAVSPGACVPLGFATSDPGTRPVVLLLFGCRAWQGDPVSQEAAQIAWYRPEALPGLAMPPLDLPLIPIVERFARLSETGAGK
jgi:8-oxo-dGTP diphosphatase